MARQTRADRMDESLGMRRGKESTKMQSYKARRDESMAMKAKSSGNGFNLRDNAQEGDVRSISTNSEQYDLGKIQKYSCGSKGYPSQAFNYKY